MTPTVFKPFPKFTARHVIEVVDTMDLIAVRHRGTVYIHTDANIDYSTVKVFGDILPTAYNPHDISDTGSQITMENYEEVITPESYNGRILCESSLYDELNVACVVFSSKKQEKLAQLVSAYLEEERTSITIGTSVVETRYLPRLISADATTGIGGSSNSPFMQPHYSIPVLGTVVSDTTKSDGRFEILNVMTGSIDSRPEDELTRITKEMMEAYLIRD